MYQEPLNELVFRFAEHQNPNACVLVLRGSAGVWSLTALQETFGRAAATGHPLVVDLSGLVSGDETLLGLLLDARITRGITLVGPITGPFARRLAVTGTDKVFDIHATVPLALSALISSGQPKFTVQRQTVE